MADKYARINSGFELKPMAEDFNEVLLITIISLNILY